MSIGFEKNFRKKGEKRKGEILFLAGSSRAAVDKREKNCYNHIVAILIKRNIDRETHERKTEKKNRKKYTEKPQL